MNLSIFQVSVGGFDDNFSYIIYNEDNKKAVVVDPTGELERITNRLQENGLDLEAIFITHTHFDHIDGITPLTNYKNVPIYVHELGKEAVQNAAPTATVHTCTNNDELTVGDAPVTVLHTPGHIADAVCFYIKKEQSTSGTPLLITGDTLFVEGCGRTSEEQVEVMYNSLTRIAELPPATHIFPGHHYGPTPTSTLAHEKEDNRFLLAATLEEFTALRLKR